MKGEIKVYLEIGKSRTLAAALDWPGWCRSGRDEATVLQTMFDYGPRYALIVSPSQLDFQLSNDVSSFVIVERLEGNATTDFGVPGKVPSSDAQALDDAELHRLLILLKACWQAFDVAVEMANGKALRLGPRGGGRSLDGIFQHVLGAEGGYLSALGGKVPSSESSLSPMERIRQAILETLAASAHGEVPERGPRGGKSWPPRYFVRREAWHVLDHIWEIEDRLIGR